MPERDGRVDVMAVGDDPLQPQTRGRLAPAEALLLGSVFVVAACGLVYELAAGTLASYLLGDSILQFSTVIGTYLFAMGCRASSSANWWRTSCASSYWWGWPVG